MDNRLSKIRHSRERGNPAPWRLCRESPWVPAFAGTTVVRDRSDSRLNAFGKRKARHSRERGNPAPWRLSRESPWAPAFAGTTVVGDGSGSRFNAFGKRKARHSRERGNPASWRLSRESPWVPAFAGTTVVEDGSGSRFNAFGKRKARHSRERGNPWTLTLPRESRWARFCGNDGSGLLAWLQVQRLRRSDSDKTMSSSGAFCVPTSATASHRQPHSEHLHSAASPPPVCTRLRCSARATARSSSSSKYTAICTWLSSAKAWP